MIYIAVQLVYNSKLIIIISSLLDEEDYAM